MEKIRFWAEMGLVFEIVKTNFSCLHLFWPKI